MFEDLEFMLVGGGVDDGVLNVNDGVSDAIQHFFHEALKGRGTAEQPHGEVTHWNCP